MPLAYRNVLEIWRVGAACLAMAIASALLSASSTHASPATSAHSNIKDVDHAGRPSPVDDLPEAYILSAGDRVRVRLIEWRRSQGETYEWPGLGGEFLIDPSGMVSLPIVGRVQVAGFSAADAGDRIAKQLQDRVGLVTRPQAAVEVSKYRSFFVVGAVDRPNAYPYQPGLNVVQAVTLAGGFYRSPALDLERQAIEARGSYSVLLVRRIGLLAAIARLHAQVKDEAAIIFPHELAEREEDEALAAVLDQERQSFEARRKSLQAKVESFDQTKSLLEAEIQTLHAKLASLERQSSLSQRELESITALYARGLALSSRQLSLEQVVAQFETQKLDLRLSISRAQQDIARAVRERTDVGDKARNEDLVELKLEQSRLAETEEQLKTARNLIANAGHSEVSSLANAYDPSRYRYEILRVVSRKAKVFDAAETDAVLPGDVVRVSSSVAISTSAGEAQSNSSSRWAARKDGDQSLARGAQ